MAIRFFNFFQRPNRDSGVTNYKGNIGTFPVSNGTIWSDWQNFPEFGDQNWLNSSQKNGVLGRDSKEHDLFESITDGYSNTFMIGEDVPLYNLHSIWIFGNGDYCTTNPPLNFLPPTPNPTRWQDVMGFRSQHSGGAQFAMCDGSVHFVTEDIDMFAYRSLSSRNGGEVQSVTEF